LEEYFFVQELYYQSVNSGTKVKGVKLGKLLLKILYMYAEM